MTPPAAARSRWCSTTTWTAWCALVKGPPATPCSCKERRVADAQFALPPLGFRSYVCLEFTCARGPSTCVPPKGLHGVFLSGDLSMNHACCRRATFQHNTSLALEQDTFRTHLCSTI